MANIAVTLAYQVKDILGDSTSADGLVLLVPDTVTLATLQTIVNSFTTVFDAVTDGMINKITAKADMNIVGAKSAPTTGGSTIEETALFNYSQAGVSWKYGIDVPAIAEAVITAGKIDLGAPVSTFYDWFTTAHSGATPVSKYQLALDTLLDVVIAFRKHRRQVSRTSTEVPA